MDHLIIDGFNLAFRCHYAHFSLQTSRGIPSGCVYGFLTSLRGVKNKFSWCHTTIAWDTQSTRKKEVYADYKANRPRSVIPDQINDLKKIFSNLNVSQVEYFGEEADDIISSLVEKYREDSNKIYIYTGDKDMLQLVVDGHVIVVTPKRSYDEAAVKEEYGVFPKDLTCYFCLRGDTVDNVPGVPRVKSSLLASLSEKYKNLDAIFDNLQNEKLTEFQLQALATFKNQADINKQLIKLRDDLILDIQTGTPNSQALATYLDKYEIKSINPNTYPNIFNDGAFNRREAPMVESLSLFD